MCVYVCMLKKILKGRIESGKVDKDKNKGIIKLK